MTRPPVPAAVVALAISSLALSGCVSPARTADQYHAKAVTTVEAASGEVATARLVVAQRLGRRVTGPYADEVVTASETALDAIDAAFGAVQPPTPASDDVHDDVGDALVTAQDAVTHARFAVRRDARGDYPGVLAELDAAGKDLADLENRLREPLS